MVLALIFDSVGFGEWLVLLAVVLVVTGPKRLPATARKLGQMYAKFRRVAEGFKRELLDLDAEMTRVAEGAEEQVAKAFTIDGDEAKATPILEA